METFELTSDPAPSKRAQQGQKDRQSLACSVRDKAYNPWETFTNCWRKRKSKLPKKAAAALGIKTVREGLLKLRPSLRAMKRFLDVPTLDALLAKYGRTGSQYWQWDHRKPVRQLDHLDPADMASGFSIANVRLRIAARNKRRKWEDPKDHMELWDGKAGV